MAAAVQLHSLDVRPPRLLQACGTRGRGYAPL